jgi:hypothetical protein
MGVSTAHDSNAAALLQILTEWTSANSYNLRVTNLRSGAGGLPKLDSTTVLDNGAGDLLVGAADLDWFFASADDQLVGKRANEFVN